MYVCSYVFTNVCGISVASSWGRRGSTFRDRDGHVLQRANSTYAYMERSTFGVQHLNFRLARPPLRPMPRLLVDYGQLLVQLLDYIASPLELVIKREQKIINSGAYLFKELQNVVEPGGGQLGAGGHQAAHFEARAAEQLEEVVGDDPKRFGWEDLRSRCVARAYEHTIHKTLLTVCHECARVEDGVHADPDGEEEHYCRQQYFCGIQSTGPHHASPSRLLDLGS